MENIPEAKISRLDILSIPLPYSKEHSHSEFHQMTPPKVGQPTVKMKYILLKNFIGK